VTILLAGALVVPSNASFAHDDDDDRDEKYEDERDDDKHESIKKFKDGVVLISSSTNSWY